MLFQFLSVNLYKYILLSYLILCDVLFKDFSKYKVKGFWFIPHGGKLRLCDEVESGVK